MDELRQYIIDCISNENYYIITKTNGDKFVNIPKRGCTLDGVKKMLGVMHIKEIILWQVMKLKDILGTS